MNALFNHTVEYLGWTVIGAVGVSALWTSIVIVEAVVGSVKRAFGRRRRRKQRRRRIGRHG